MDGTSETALLHWRDPGVLLHNITRLSPDSSVIASSMSFPVQFIGAGVVTSTNAKTAAGFSASTPSQVSVPLHAGIICIGTTIVLVDETECTYSTVGVGGGQRNCCVHH
ncbi:Uncharacterized protein DAT39_014881 [Clarias magur]|uniref:Uncharacterized protein n=1 Tax=Clarias magur TaxID=1594786 RepID=A0A8J4TZM7_CLAMG|nr:Uncharacterized protein DAT39_014881 [Clarias magur]